MNKGHKQQVKIDILKKLGLYCCFIPVLIYAYCLFGYTEENFLKIFKDLLDARKSSLGQVLNRYNKKEFNELGLVVFFDEPGLNLVVGKLESVHGFKEHYRPPEGEGLSLLTGGSHRSGHDISGTNLGGEYVNIGSNEKL